MRRCRYCHTTENITKDHIIPKCRGGKNSQSNIQPLCARCNVMKGGKTDKEIADLFRLYKTLPIEELQTRRRGKWYLEIIKNRLTPLNWA